MTFGNILQSFDEVVDLFERIFSYITVGDIGLKYLKFIKKLHNEIYQQIFDKQMYIYCVVYLQLQGNITYFQITKMKQIKYNTVVCVCMFTTRYQIISCVSSEFLIENGKSQATIKTAESTKPQQCFYFLLSGNIKIQTKYTSTVIGIFL
ncbi:Hypothetical_protein [Hexamita inflata]|uniref:Hypothetical_protein n=1 Tax=Hexamita inflata TaxID=28002 RepID=A0ABP1KJB4_9EUKA